MPLARMTASGRLAPDLLAPHRQVEAVVQDAVTRGTEGMKAAFRDALRAAFPGSRRAANLVGSQVFPDRTVSINAAGSVFGRGGKASAWPAPLRLFNEGGTILPGRAAGSALAIPTARVPMKGRRRMTPDEVSRSFKERLTLVRAKPGGRAWGYLVLRTAVEGKRGRLVRGTKRRIAAGAEAKAKATVMFILVPSVTVTKRLDFDAIARRWASQMPSLLDAAATRIMNGGRA